MIDCSSYAAQGFQTFLHSLAGGPKYASRTVTFVAQSFTDALCEAKRLKVRRANSGVLLESLLSHVGKTFTWEYQAFPKSINRAFSKHVYIPEQEIAKLFSTLSNTCYQVLVDMQHYVLPIMKAEKPPTQSFKSQI